MTILKKNCMHQPSVNMTAENREREGERERERERES